MNWRILLQPRAFEVASPECPHSKRTWLPVPARGAREQARLRKEFLPFPQRSWWRVQAWFVRRIAVERRAQSSGERPISCRAELAAAEYPVVPFAPVPLERIAEVPPRAASIPGGARRAEIFPMERPRNPGRS